MEHLTDVRPDPVLSPIATEAGMGGAFIWPQIAPARQVTSSSFKYGAFDFGPKISDDMDTRMPPAGPANVSKSPTITYTEGLVQPHGLKDKFEDYARAESANPAQWEAGKVANLAAKLSREIERAVKAVLDAAANATTLTGANQWNDSGTTPTIEKSIDTAMQAFDLLYGMQATHLVVPRICWDYLKRDATVRDAIKYTSPDILNGRGGLPERVFGLQLVVPGAIYNTSNPGQTAAAARVWGSSSSDDKVYLLHVNPASATDNSVPTALNVVTCPQLPDLMFTTKTWRPTAADEKWTWYLIECAYKLISQAGLIYRLDDVLE